MPGGCFPKSVLAREQMSDQHCQSIAPARYQRTPLVAKAIVPRDQCFELPLVDEHLRALEQHWSTSLPPLSFGRLPQSEHAARGVTDKPEATARAAVESAGLLEHFVQAGRRQHTFSVDCELLQVGLSDARLCLWGQVTEAKRQELQQELRLSLGFAFSSQSFCSGHGGILYAPTEPAHQQSQAAGLEVGRVMNIARSPTYSHRRPRCVPLA